MGSSEDLTEYRKDPSLEKFSSQQFCLDKCKCRLCVRKREGRATGWLNFVPYHTDFACLCLECRRIEWQQAEIKRQRHNILRYRRQIRDPGSYVGFYLCEEDDKRQKRLAKLVKESEITLKATEEALRQKYGIVVTKVDELQIEQEQQEDKQAEYRRNFLHTCLRCILEDDDKLIRSKSKSESENGTTGFGTHRPKEQFVFGTRSPGNKAGLWKVLEAGPKKASQAREQVRIVLWRNPRQVRRIRPTLLKRRSKSKQGSNIDQTGGIRKENIS